MKYLIQVWAIPAIDLPKEIKLPSGISIKTVTINYGKTRQTKAFLIESIALEQSVKKSPEVEFQHIGNVLYRLSFSLLHPLHVYSARIIPSRLKGGDHFEEQSFPGSPPGIALVEHRIGFKKITKLDSSFLSGDLSTELEIAISWFVLGISVSNPLQQVLCHWIGIESLAESITSPLRCPSCGALIYECPYCRQSTNGIRTVQSIRDFLVSKLGLSKREFESLYKFRCRVIHGGVKVDPAGIEEITKKSLRIQQLLLKAIKRSLNWPLYQPPIIKSNGVMIIGSPALTLEGTFSDAKYYDQPSVHPN